MPYNLDEISRIADNFGRSGYFKDCTNPQQAFTKILAGQGLGIDPMSAMSMLHIVQGKIAMDASLVASKIKSSNKYDYDVLESTAKKCSLQFRQGDKILGQCTFSMEDAQAAGLATRATWKAFPTDMLRSRAMTRGARTFTPDVFGGPIYTPEEIEQEIPKGNAPVKDVSKDATPIKPPSDKQEQLTRAITAYTTYREGSSVAEAGKHIIDAIVAKFELTERPANAAVLTTEQLAFAADHFEKCQADQVAV